MRKSVAVCAVVSFAGLAFPAIGEEARGTVVAIHCTDPQPGALTRLEEGFKKHAAWHRAQKDTWTWATWIVLTGPETDRLCTGTFDHKWEDFDKPFVSPQADRADALLNIAPAAKKHEATFWARLDALSRPPTEPTTMSSVVFFQVRVGMDEEFNSVVAEYHKAIEKTQMPWRYTWYALASGGDDGSYALVLPRNGFAGFNPTGKPFREMLVEAYGETAADALEARWREAVASSRHQLIMGRPDLGYSPNP
jgi:hypothetical protein